MDFSELTKKKPEKSLTEVKRKHSGRNNNGHITVRHKGGGTRLQYRIIDFKRRKDDIPAKVAAIGTRVGYESDAAFSRAFKRETGLSPAAWRRSRQQAAPGT